MRLPALLLFFSFFLLSCAPSTIRVEVPFTDDVFLSADGLLRGRVPNGWFVSTDSQITPQIGVALLSEDYSAALILQEIFPDKNAERRIAKEGLQLLAQISFQLKLAEYPQARIVSPPQSSSLRGIEMCSYIFLPTENDMRLPVVLFQMRGHFYESSTIILKPSTVNDIGTLLSVQQAIVGTLN